MRSLVLLTVVVSVLADTRFGARTTNEERLCHDLLDEFYDPVVLKTTTETCVRETKGAQRLLDDLRTTFSGVDKIHVDPTPPRQPSPSAPLQPPLGRPANQPLPRPTLQPSNLPNGDSTSTTRHRTTQDTNARTQHSGATTQHPGATTQHPGATTQHPGAPHHDQDHYDPAEDLERAGFVQEARGVRECVAKSQGDVSATPTGGSSFNVAGFKNKIRGKISGTSSEVPVERGLSNCPTRPLEVYDAHEFVHCLEDYCSGKRQ